MDDFTGGGLSAACEVLTLSGRCRKTTFGPLNGIGTTTTRDKAMPRSLRLYIRKCTSTAVIVTPKVAPSVA